MENIFENAKFGDKFLTRDDRIAVFVGTYIDEDNEPWWKFVISGENEIRFYNVHAKSGLLDMSEVDFPNDIVGKYQEPIDEVQLDSLNPIIEEESLKAAFCGLVPDAETEGLRQFNVFSYAYKLGYKKAKEE